MSSRLLWTLAITYFAVAILVTVLMAPVAPEGYAESSARRPATVATAVLRGDQQGSQADDSDGRGLFGATLRPDGLCYVLLVRSVESAQAARIHTDGRGAAHGVVATLTTPSSGKPVWGCLRPVPNDQDSAQTLSRRELGAIRKDPSRVYVDVPGGAFRANAVRGQLTEASWWDRARHGSATTEEG